MAGLFQVLHGRADGGFRRAEVLVGTDGQPLIIPATSEGWKENICTRPFAVDWDGDGHLDLVVGNFTGAFYLFKGQGRGRFPPKPEEIRAGDRPLKIEGYHSDPFVVDWDGDGDLDLLSGSGEGGVQWAENRAGPGKPPRLGPPRWLIGRGPRLEYGQTLREPDIEGPLSSTRIWVDDVNSDGKLDLLVGELAPLVSPVGRITEAEFKRKFADWRKAVGEAAGQLNASCNDAKQRDKAQQHYQDIYSRRGEFMKEDRTGFVWLFLRK